MWTLNEQYVLLLSASFPKEFLILKTLSLELRMIK